MGREEGQREFYKQYYARTGAGRNDLRRNPGVLLQSLTLERSFILASRNISHDAGTAKPLDVGCGGGGDLFQLLRVGYKPENITGIDIQAERLESARHLYPNIRFIAGDASRMDFPSGEFDLVFESTMFATLSDDAVSSAIASEMLRVCKGGGYLLLLDWRTPKPRDPNYNALTKGRLRRLFKVGADTELVGVYPGALVPPVGRFLSAHLPSLYFLTAAIFPFLVGQVAYLLRKK